MINRSKLFTGSECASLVDQDTDRRKSGENLYIHDFCMSYTLCLLQRANLAKPSVLFPKLQMLPIDNSKKSEKEKREIPRRHKPVVQ